jgi:hypothetical protein
MPTHHHIMLLNQMPFYPSFPKSCMNSSFSFRNKPQQTVVNHQITNPTFSFNQNHCFTFLLLPLKVFGDKLFSGSWSQDIRTYIQLRIHLITSEMISVLRYMSLKNWADRKFSGSIHMYYRSKYKNTCIIYAIFHI